MCVCIQKIFLQKSLYSYFSQVEKCHNAEMCASSEKRWMIVKKHFKIKYPFLAEKMRSEVQKIIQQKSEIQNIELVTDPCCVIQIQGTEAAIEEVEPEILNYILLLESNIISSTLQFVDCFTRPALKSPEMLQLCKELSNKLAVSLKIQLQPKTLLSTSVTFSKSNAVVQICEGDITLDSNSDAFINFTDRNLTMSDEVMNKLSQAEIKRHKRHVKQNGPQLAGRAFCFCRSSNDVIVIHAVLPSWTDGNRGEGNLITAAVLESLKLAMEYKAASVSLPFFSCADVHLPLDLLAQCCLSAVHKFLMYSDHVQTIRLVLPINMAEKFLDKFTSGIFKQYIITDEQGIIKPDNIQKFCNLGKSAWLWEDDDGMYHYYKPEDNEILNRESGFHFNASHNLQIGPHVCTVNFRTMTQVNTCTMKERKVMRISLNCIWQFKTDENIWVPFSPQVSLMIEALYLTGTNHYLTINNQSYSYDFKHMVQLNVDTSQETGIRRVDSTSMVVSDDTYYSTGKSKISISGSAVDINIVEEKLQQCLKSLVTVQCIDIQRKYIPALEKSIRGIQTSNSVKIVKISEVDDVMVRYTVTGYKDCVQKAIIEMYKATTTACCSVHKPIEWEAQSNSIELKNILKGSPEWTKISSHMRMTLDCNIISVKRIQNDFLWEKYVQHKELMSCKGFKSTNEMELFHGTKTNPPEYIYESEEGFDMRYSHKGLWGLGNYFAENANYASCFAYQQTNDILQLFLVKVLVGDSCEISPDNTLRMPLFKPDGKVRYDTVNGWSKGSRVYITYLNDKAYPFYLISYTVQSQAD